jgi:hypothetical protein
VLVRLVGRIYKLRHLGDLRYHDIHANIYDDLFINSSNIKVNISTD